MPAHPNAALLIRCRTDGTCVEILQDEFGVKPQQAGDTFVSLFASAGLSKASRFLRAAAHRCTLDWQMDIPLPEGAVSLFFTGIRTGLGIVILAAEEPLAAKPAGAGSASSLERTAHDLRNPVSGILAASEFLLDDIDDKGGGLEEHQLNLLRSIQASSGLALRLIDEMLETPAGSTRPGGHGAGPKRGLVGKATPR